VVDSMIGYGSGYVKISFRDVPQDYSLEFCRSKLRRTTVLCSSNVFGGQERASPCSAPVMGLRRRNLALIEKLPPYGLQVSTDMPGV